MVQILQPHDLTEEPHEEDHGHNTSMEEFQPGTRFYLAFASLTILAMMVSLDGTSVSVALPIMAQSLNGSATEVFWTGTSYLLSTTVLLLPLGALSHILGRVSVLLACIVFFASGIIISALAKEYTLMLVGRTIQGIGGGGIILLNDIIMTDLVPIRLRGIYSGIIGGVWALGSISGPVIGGAIAYKAKWPWIFWINIPFAAIAFVMVSMFLRLERIPGSTREKLGRVDWLGNLLLISSTTSFLMPVTWGGIQYAWNSWKTLLPLLLGITGAVGLCLYEWRVAKEPTIRLNILRNYNMAYSLLATFVNALIVYGALYFLPLYYEVVMGYNPVVAGLALFPATFTIAPVSIISGIIITKTGDFRKVTWIGWTATTLGCGIMMILDTHTTVVQWTFLTLCAGIGLGFLYTSLSFVNQAAVEEENMAFAVSLFVFFRSFGQCVGVAIGGTTFQNQMKHRLQEIPFVADRAAEFTINTFDLVQFIETMPDGKERSDLIQAFSDSLRMVWAVMCALSTAALIGSFWIRKISLDRHHFTEQRLQRKATS